MNPGIDIDTDTIESVLIGGTWYQVADGSFYIDRYTFGEDEQSHQPFGAAAGFAFIEPGGGTHMAGPLTSVQTVRYR